MYDTPQNTKQIEGVFYLQILKELSLDPSLVSNTYDKKILRSLKSEAAKPSTSSFASDSPTTEKSKTLKLSSTKTRSTTLKPRIKQTHKKEFSTTKDDDDENYESSKESFATSTKEWKSYYQ